MLLRRVVAGLAASISVGLLCAEPGVAAQRWGQPPLMHAPGGCPPGRYRLVCMSLAAPRESPPPSHDADPNVTLPRKVRDVTPRYPPVAYARRLEGVVRIQADINEDGRVVNARVVTSSAPEFDGPALEAIRQWEFTPTLLDGVPVSVPMTTDIKFSLR